MQMIVLSKLQRGKMCGINESTKKANAIAHKEGPVDGHAQQGKKWGKLRDFFW